VKFSEWWSDDDEAEAVGVLPLCEDGRHTGTISRAEIKDLKFKVSDRNPSGTSLVVKVAIPKHQAVESIAPVQFRGQIEAICRAARVNTPDPSDDWDVSQLVGQVVVIETVFGIGKTGREYVRVDRWHPGPDPLPETKAAARTPAARIAAAGHGGNVDDIPF
jgi:hypothetical protein